MFDNLPKGTDFESLTGLVKMNDDSTSVRMTEEAGCVFLADELESILDKGSDELTQGQGAQFTIVDRHGVLDVYSE